MGVHGAGVFKYWSAYGSRAEHGIDAVRRFGDNIVYFVRLFDTM